MPLAILESRVALGSTARTAPDRPPLPVGLAVFLLLACSLAISNNNADADLWGHVRYGQDLLRDGLSQTATHTFTAEGFAWINHENLAEVAFALLVDLGGAAALLICKFLLGLAVLGAMLRAARRQQGGAMASALVLVLVAVNLTAGWTMRPQLFSYALFALEIVLLDRAFDATGRPRNPAWLLLAWPLFAIWANTHGGFVAGLAVFGLYTTGRALQALARQGRQSLPTVAALAGITLGAVGATLLTPYGIELWRWLIASLGPPRPEIPEWIGLTWSDTKFAPFAALAALTGAALAQSRRPRDPVQIVVLAAIAAQSVAHQRHIPFFAIAAGFWIPGYVESLLARFQKRGRESYLADAPKMTPDPFSRVNLALAAACIAVAIPLTLRLREIPVERREYPVSALEFMAQRDLHGKLVVTFNWAQYALAALAPRTTVAFDGRYDTCYPPDVVDAHFDFVLGNDPTRRWRNPRSPAFDATRTLQQGEPDLVLIQRSQQPAIDTMRAQTDWVLLYQDALAQLWGRRSEYDDPALATFIPPALRQITDAPQIGSVAWPGFPPQVTAHQQPLAN